MNEHNEQLSALIDNELDNTQIMDALVQSVEQQDTFSRYHLIGDIMREEAPNILLDIDLGAFVLAQIEKDNQTLEVPVDFIKMKKNNILSFTKRFGQYAIAASVAGVVVLTSVMMSQPNGSNAHDGLEVLSTIPLGGAASPVSLRTDTQESPVLTKEQKKRTEALLKDHQLQIQIQP